MSLFEKTVVCDIITIPGTDHRGVTIEFQLTDVSRGPSYWKFNENLLKNAAYLDLINHVIDEHIVSSYLSDPRVTWDMCKIKIKEATISYCRNKARVNRNKVTNLRNDLNEVHKNLAINPGRADLITKAQRLQMELEIAGITESKAAQVRARTKWAEEGEKSTKFFPGLEKSKAAAKTIYSLKFFSNITVTHQNDIHQEITNYYKNLYKSKFDLNDRLEALGSFAERVDVPKLSDEDKEWCDNQLTLDDLGEALKCMTNGSSPGCDGLTTSFYKVFWAKIGGFVYASFEKSFEDGQLSLSQRRAIIVLLHKGKNLPRDIIGN